MCYFPYFPWSLSSSFSSCGTHICVCEMVFAHTMNRAGHALRHRRRSLRKQSRLLQVFPAFTARVHTRHPVVHPPTGTHFSLEVFEGRHAIERFRAWQCNEESCASHALHVTLVSSGMRGKTGRRRSLSALARPTQKNGSGST